MERLTNQKQIILEYLQDTKTHPTVEEIFIGVKKKLPRISLGTVYRNLENFHEKGLIIKIDGEVKRFDGDISDHHHFLCRKCNKAFDIFEKEFDVKKIIKKAKKIGNIEHGGICVSGICLKCQK